MMYMIKVIFSGRVSLLYLFIMAAEIKVPEKGNDKLKICPVCKTAFACKPKDCWCANMPEKLPMLDSGDCYCPKCMENILDKKQGSAM